jgi:hypothetical protein
MKISKESEYLVKRNVDVFLSGKTLPLVQGRGFFKSKNASRCDSEFKKFKFVYPKEELIFSPKTQCSMKKHSPQRIIFKSRPFNIFENERKSRFKFPSNLKRNFKVNNCRQGPMLGFWRRAESLRPRTRQVSEKEGSGLQNRPSCFPQEMTSPKNDPGTKKMKMCVFMEDQKVRDLIPALSNIKIPKSKLFDSKNEKFYSGVTKFKKVSVVLCKFLLGEAVQLSEVQKLSPTENEILLLYVNKKKMAEHQVQQLGTQELADLSKNWNKKRTNKNLRYVVNKVLKMMKTYFKSELYGKIRNCLRLELQKLNEKAQLDYCFYGYYFLDAVNYLTKQVECYFHPNSKRNPQLATNPWIPNHISETYLNNLRTSKLFVRDFVLFLKGSFRQEAKLQAANSILKSAKTWEKICKDQGPEALMQNIKGRFINNPKGKFPWGLQEVEDGIKNILFKLGQL